jgi:serine/threonine protein kinase
VTNGKACPNCHNLNSPGAQFCAACGAALGGNSGHLRVSQVLNARFTIQRPLSKGGMGALYLASEMIAGQERQVVVKEMLDYYDRSDPQGEAKAQQRFQAEAATLAALNIPGVPQIFDFFSERGRNYIVMQFVEGRNLESGLTHLDETGKTVKGRAYPIEQVRRWGVQLCKVLESLAAQQVVHMDIKPANLIVDQAGVVWLVDFGTAKAPLPGSPGLSHTSVPSPRKSSVYGTLGYAPLEQASGKPEARSDVYALAATLYHLATDDDPGQHPGKFPGLDRLPADFASPLRQALALDVRQRLTASQMQRLLEPRATRQLGFHWQDGTVTLDPADLPAAANLRWEEAGKYFASDAWERWLKDQHRNDLAASLLQIRTQQKDRNLALDAFLRVVDPNLPPPQLFLPVKSINAGILPWRQKMELDLELRNVGGGCLVAQFTNLPPGIQTRPQTAVVRDRLIIHLTLDTAQLSPSPQPLDLPLPIDTGKGGRAVLTIKVQIPEPAVALKPTVLTLGRPYKGQHATSSLIITNLGKSLFNAEARVNAAWWSIEPERFTCPPGQSRSLHVNADTRRMRLGAQEAQIVIQARAGTWEQTLQVPAHLVVSFWKTFIRFWAPPLAIIILAALIGAFIGWGAAYVLDLNSMPLNTAVGGGLVGGLFGAILGLLGGMLVGASGWPGTGRGRPGLRLGGLVGALLGLACGGLAGALVGWLNGALGLLTGLTGGLVGAALGAIGWIGRR